MGNRWLNRDDFAWSTSYGVSYTDRHEDTPSPAEERQFAGFRLGSELRMKMGAISSFDNEFTRGTSASATSTTIRWTSELGLVVMSKHMSLKVSLQYLVNHQPALEDVDVIARVVLEDPDGIPRHGGRVLSDRRLGRFGDRACRGSGAQASVGHGFPHRPCD